MKPSARNLVLLCAALMGAACGDARTPDEYRIAGRDAQKQGDLAAAERHLTKALQIAETSGADTKLLGSILDDLTQLHVAREDLPRAEQFGRRALVLRETALPPTDRAVTRSVDRLAWIALKQGRLDEAAALYERTMKTLEKTAGPTDEGTADAIDRVAHVYSRQKRFEDAATGYRRALAIREARFGPVHEEVADGLERLANVYMAAERPTEAEPLLSRSLEIRERDGGPREVAETRRRLALSHTAQGRYRDAETSLLAALTVLEKAPPDEARDGGLLRMVLENYASLLLQSGRGEEAAQMKQRAKAIGAQDRASGNN